MAELERLGLATERGTSLSSVIARIEGTAEGAAAGPTILLRADMDGLPVQEDSGLDFASTIEGAMHACGHDTHMTMLLGAARLLLARRDRLAGRVLLMFQPGEEGHHGARFMLDEGLLDPVGRRGGPERCIRDPHQHPLSERDGAAPGRRDAGRQRHAADRGPRSRRARLDTAPRPRPDPDRGRDRPRPADDGRAAGRRLRPCRRHDRPRRGRHDDQHHPGGSPPGGHDPDRVGGDADPPSPTRSAGSSPASPPLTAPRPR